ncbi:MAG TPA: ATP-binding cassette domain-containing protein [Paracoccaceae bacterium]|nr:ATP-binding cassette domain-containing protein [Paracoccaceae bacterium]
MTAPGVELAGRGLIDGVPLFGPVELRLAAGQWTCVLGPSGVGKSTILRLIAELPTGVGFEGTIRATDGAPLAGRIALMAQSDLLLPWLDVLGNVLVGARMRGEPPDTARARAMVARVGLGGRDGERPRHLSGGERQRVALARTLMENRPVVLLDEPFSALDARTRAEMQVLAAELLSGRTVLLVTHDPAEAARLGHRILVLTETGLAEIPPPPSPPVRPVGDPDAFACQTALYRAIGQPA